MACSTRQRTIRTPVERSGKGLFHGREATVRLLPAEENTGLRFRRSDIAGSTEAVLSPDILGKADRHTVIRVGSAAVAMTEHLLAAVMGLCIDNLFIELDAEEMPCLDGSALGFAEAILEAGIEEQEAEALVLTPTCGFTLGEDEVSLSVGPSDGLTLRYTLDYGDAYVGRQSVGYDITPETFLNEIAPARTYALRPEVDAFLARGLGGGATEENVVILEPDGSTTPETRFPDECCRHKVLDLLGDLCLIGCRLNAEVVGVGSGHDMNHAAARGLIQHGSRSAS